MANNPRVFLDISVSSKTVGRIECPAFGRVLDGLDVMARVGRDDRRLRGNALASLVMARRALGGT
ncbi:hypothetical protein HID58_035648 [Brassica napus]|uniref:Uncharacterized protein n=1 Tax=Brassica napus TaxID=3708 RepID=A0ABQ8C5I0_BRANA|nr:hypothetical protein HID58_035648 [Brassica napus]